LSKNDREGDRNVDGDNITILDDNSMSVVIKAVMTVLLVVLVEMMMMMML